MNDSNPSKARRRWFQFSLRTLTSMSDEPKLQLYSHAHCVGDRTEISTIRGQRVAIIARSVDGDGKWTYTVLSNASATFMCYESELVYADPITSLSTDSEKLADEIARDLRSVIEVPRLNPNGFLARPGFWKRCQVVRPGWDARSPDARIYVDGFNGACGWNSWKVFTDALEDGLCIWLGYACYDARWRGHCWCMLDNRIVESTASYNVYYGAELTRKEHVEFGEKFGSFDMLSREGLEVCTIVNGLRKVVPYDPAVHGDGICRERDPETQNVRQGLGQ